MGKLRLIYGLLLLFGSPLTAQSQQLSSKECEKLGFTGLALCSDCNTFAEYVKDQEDVYCKFAKCASIMAGFGSLGGKTKNLIVAGGLTGFVFGVYFYTMRAVGGSDELQLAIDKFEAQKSKTEPEAMPKA